MKRRFEQLVDQHGSRLYQLARLMLGRDDEAEDVAQETLVKLWRNVDSLHAGQELSWLITCTRNACLDILRGRTRTRGLLRLQPRLTGRAPAWRLVHRCDVPHGTGTALRAAVAVDPSRVQLPG